MVNQRMIVLNLICLSATLVIGQTLWQKYTNNPIMVKTNPIYEFYAIGQPTCVIVNDTFKMWYAAAGIDHKGRILHAYSTDGINWIKHGGGTPVIDVGGVGEWDSHWLDTPEALSDPSGYKLYYFGNTSDTVQTSRGIGLATSTNGINWQKHAGNPVISKGDSLSWEGFWIESSTAFFCDDTFRMWYTGVARDYKCRVGYATSTDGITWTKYPSNPVLDLGLHGSWEDYMVGIASVIKNGNLYQMWYCGVSAADLSNSIIDTPRVGYAYSTNGKNWTKFPGNPILTPFNPPRDTAGPWAPAVVFTGSNYRMWYETAIGFCYATAPPNAITENSRTKEDCRLEIFPNPCTRSCNINYSIPKNDRVKIDIYDIQGRLLKEIVNENQKTGRYIAYWDGRDDKNNQVGGGIYLCVMLTSNKIQGIKKVIVL